MRTREGIEHERGSMIEYTHATIRRLLEAGFMMSFHSYLSLTSLKANITAFGKEPHMTLQGRSSIGDFGEALLDSASDRYTVRAADGRALLVDVWATQSCRG
jgi:hypothetical protein